ncbi:MAG: TlpA disulfide reductase family protein [Acidobacteriota bacterium]
MDKRQNTNSQWPKYRTPVGLRSLLLLLPILCGVHSAARAQRTPPTLAEFKAEKIMVETVAGKRVELSKLLGQGKAVVLDFWATWCGPCRQEIPHLVALARQHGKEIIFLGLNLEDPAEKRAAVKSFIKEYAMNYQVVFAPAETYQFFNPGADGYRIPQTIVFGPDGKLIKRLVGYNPGIGKEILDKAVQQALGNK